jgi:hypothetical protein
MMDNVRRGSEIIGGKGMEAQTMAFGVLYKLQISKRGKIQNLKLNDPFISSGINIAQIFKLILDAASGSKTKVK